MAVDYYFIGQSAGNSSSGTITPAQFGPQSANTVLSGPTTGAAANPTFRALVANDLPGTLNATTFVGNVTLGGATPTSLVTGIIIGSSTTGTALVYDSANGLRALNTALSANKGFAGTQFTATNASASAIYGFGTGTGSETGMAVPSATSLGFKTNGTTALSIDSSQNATFSATVKVQSGGTIRSGSGAPAGALGSVGDIYLNTAAAGGTTNFYVKTGASTWTAVA